MIERSWKKDFDRMFRDHLEGTPEEVSARMDALLKGDGLEHPGQCKGDGCQDHRASEGHHSSLQASKGDMPE